MDDESDSESDSDSVTTPPRHHLRPLPLQHPSNTRTDARRGVEYNPGTPLNISTQHTTARNTQFHQNTPPNISTQHTPSTNNQNQPNTPTQPTKLLISLINVCGVKNRKKSVKFYKFINNYDVILMTETKLNELDRIDFPGFKLITITRRSTDAGLMLAQRLRRWTNINQALEQIIPTAVSVACLVVI